MITKLTKEQEAKISDYTKKWLDYGLNTDECDFEKAKAAVKQCYKLAGLSEPKIFLGPFNCPMEACIANAVVEYYENGENKNINKKKFNEFLRKNIKKYFSAQIYGNMDSWFCFYDFFINEGLIENNQLDGLIELAKHSGWWTPLSDVVILQHRPKKITFDEENRLHDLDGPAIEYRGHGLSNVYAIHGIRVTKKIIDRDFTWKDIDSEENAELRRVLIDLYGLKRYIKDSNAKKIHEDDFGTLYLKAQDDDEDILIVKVVNSTAEPDGSFKDYFLRVDPKLYGGIKTARAAVASTWRNEDGSLIFKNPEEYVLEFES